MHALLHRTPNAGTFRIAKQLALIAILTICVFQGVQAADTGITQDSAIWIVATFQEHPELAIFLALALGYWIGAVKFGSFSLGAVTGTLLAGVLIGQMDISVSSQVKSIFFLMFLFAVGYGVGPQFVRGIAHDGAPQALFAALICVLCLATAYGAAKLAGYDIGFSAGLYAGATTISASIGLATDAINRAGIENAQQALNHIPIAYAVTYLFGTIGTGMILAYLGPTLLRVNLAEECKRYEREHSAGEPEGGMALAWHQLSLRAFKITPDGHAAGKTVAQAEALQPEVRVFIERIRRNGEIIDFDADTVLKAGDIVAVSGPTASLVSVIEPNAEEVADRELENVPVESVDVFVQKKNVNGKSLAELSKEGFARGVYLTKITRGATSVEIPILAQTKIYRGDILKISGSKVHTDRVIAALGYADRPATATDVIYVGAGIVLGGLVGALVLPVGGVPITLSTSGGALIAGLIFGWLRCIHPTFGRVPAPALWIMNSVGLNVFIAVVGISAGPGFIAGLQEAGVGLFFWGVVVTSIPMLLAPYIGKYLFRFDPAINLGCCGGARTSTASVAMVGDKAQSNVPMLGYTVPYAVSNTLLTLWGMVIVLLLV
ncbi:MAG: aspartate-alanine antiporter [Thiocapsa sp.]|nr:aspartate-alanine antiporter [Thiocapsa sp.]MCG6897108.1 aspartate-alanine antiporter [Thiocapsa sp.]